MVRISQSESPKLFSDAVNNFNNIWDNPRFRPVSFNSRSDIEDALDKGKNGVREC